MTVRTGPIATFSVTSVGSGYSGIDVAVGHGASLGQFTISSTDATNFTGIEGYWWLGMP